MNQIIKQLKKYFTIWWIPLSVYLIVIGIFAIGASLKRDWIMDAGLLLFCLNILGTIISSIVQLIIRKWYFVIPQLGVTAVLFYYISMLFFLSPPDYYGAHKLIPDNIDFSEPISGKPTQDQYDASDLIVAHYGQPGMYAYYSDYTPTEDGYLYIQAYEITSNDRLSKDPIKKQSKIQAKYSVSQIYEGRFTVYEGSWGDKYGSRIELWFQPSTGKKEYKIAERNYIIEGWMR